METDGEGSLTEKTIDVKKFINHESFNYKETKSYDHDICILELAEEVDLATYSPACLAKSSDTTTWDGKNALVYGNVLLGRESVVREIVQDGAPLLREVHPQAFCLKSPWGW